MDRAAANKIGSPPRPLFPRQKRAPGENPLPNHRQTDRSPAFPGSRRSEKPGLLQDFQKRRRPESNRCGGFCRHTGAVIARFRTCSVVVPCDAERPANTRPLAVFGALSRSLLNRGVQTCLFKSGHQVDTNCGPRRRTKAPTALRQPGPSATGSDHRARLAPCPPSCRGRLHQMPQTAFPAPRKGNKYPPFSGP
jgi:hypothetical protein